MIGRLIVLLTVLLSLAGCATHTHIGDCSSCTGFVIVQCQAHDGVQTQEIYGAVGTAIEKTLKDRVPRIIQDEHKALLEQAARAAARATPSPIPSQLEEPIPDKDSAK